MNRLCDLLGIRIPILQAPAGSIAGPELAAAVSGACALGGMGLTWTPVDAAVLAVRAVREATPAPFFVNYALSFDPKSLPTVLEAGAPIITFSWGDAGQWIPLVHAAGGRVGVQVGNLLGAWKAVADGADFIICQGMEAGGHVQSTTELDALLDAVVAEVGGRTPIVAAGGITTGADFAHVLARGADGVMLGTRFVATGESRAHEVYKRRIVEAGDYDTALTICFDGGWPHAPHRVLRNGTLDEWEAAGSLPPGRRPGEGEPVAWTEGGAEILRYEDTAPRAGMRGLVEEMALYAGVGSARIHDLPAAADLVRELWKEASALLAAEPASGTAAERAD